MLKPIFFLLVISLIFVVTSGTALAKHSDNIRPGWGFGETNHLHVGPPGLSVLPISQNNNAYVYNYLSIASNTGGNIAGHTSAIFSAPSSVVINILNFLNKNILNI